MELDYKKLLLELYNASDADALYQLIVFLGWMALPIGNRMGGILIMLVFLKISNLLLKTLWSKS